MILQPDIRGFSIALDGAYRTSWSREQHFLSIGGSARVSPTVTWSAQIPIIDSVTMQPSMMQQSRSVVALGMVAGVGYLFRVSNPKLDFAIETTVNLSLRALVGDATDDPSLMLNTIGVNQQTFLGGEARLKLHFNDVRVFMSLPFLWVPGRTDIHIEGLTGVRVLFGVELKGTLYSFDVTRPGKIKKVKREIVDWDKMTEEQKRKYTEELRTRLQFPPPQSRMMEPTPISTSTKKPQFDL